MRILVFLINITLMIIAPYSGAISANETLNPLSLINNDIIIEKGKVLPADHFLGNLNAPVVLIEYASFTCPHCASFAQDVFPLIKEKYIDTGKLLYIYRDFPLDAFAFKASVLSHCYASKKHCKESCKEGDENCCKQSRDYFNMNKALFSSLKRWSYPYQKDVTGLLEVAEIAKMTEEEFYACIKDHEIQQQVLTSKLYAIHQLGIDSSPIFFINGKRHDGTIKFEGFANIFNEIINLSSNK